MRANLSTVTLLEELVAIVQHLEESGVRYALAGGLAVAVWGVARATEDVDLVVAPDDVDAACEALATLGFTVRALPMTFSDGTRLQRVTKLSAEQSLVCDLLLARGPLESVLDSRVELELQGQPLHVVSRDALIAMKASSGRPQDLADIQKLQELDR